MIIEVKHGETVWRECVAFSVLSSLISLNDESFDFVVEAQAE